MKLAQQWERIRDGLPAGWTDARLALRLADEQHATRAAGLLAPLTPGRAGPELHFQAAAGGAGPSPDAVERILRRLDEEGIEGKLELRASGAAVSDETPASRTLAESWDAVLATLPRDWSDLYVEVELTSSDHLEPAAIALAPTNPARYGAASGFRFRSARRFGYGASAAMVRRCLARLDERGIPGEVTILQVLSDTKPVATQGPVWYAGGKVV